MTSTTLYNGVSEEMHNHLVRCFNALTSACKVNTRGYDPIVRGTMHARCAGVFHGKDISFTIEGEGVVIRFDGAKYAHFLPLRGSRFPTMGEFHTMWKTAECDRIEARRAEFNGVSEELHAHFVRCIRAVEHAINMHFGLSIRRGTTMVSCNNALRSSGVCFVVDVENDTVRIKFEAAPNYSYAITLGQPFPTYDELKNVWTSAFEEAERFAAERAQKQFPSPEHLKNITLHLGKTLNRLGFAKTRLAVRPGPVINTVELYSPGSGRLVETFKHPYPQDLFTQVVEKWCKVQCVLGSPVHAPKERLPATRSKDLAGLVERFNAIRSPNSGSVTVRKHGGDTRFVWSTNYVRDEAEIIEKTRLHGVGRYKVELEELVPVGGDEVVWHVRDIVEVVVAPAEEAPVPKRTFSKVTELKIKHEDRDEEAEREQERERKADIAFSEYEKRKDALKLPLSIEYVQSILDGMLEERGFARGRLVVADVANDFCLYDYNAYSLGRFTRIGLDYLKLTETVNAWCVHKEKQRRDAFRHALDFFGGMHPDEQFVSMPHATPTLRDGLTPVVVIDLFNEAEDAYERHRTDPMHSGDRREHYHEWGMRKAAEIKERLTVDARNTLREWPTCEGVPMKIEVTEPTGKGIFIARWVKG